MSTHLLVDVERLPDELQGQLASLASPVSAEDARHLASLLDDDDEDDREREARFQEITRRAEDRDQHAARMRRAINGEEPFLALGTYPRSQPRPHVDPLADERERDREDPLRLVRIVNEVARFTDDRRVIVEASVAHAERCGIPVTTFVPIITEAVRNLVRGGGRRAG